MPNKWVYWFTELGQENNNLVGKKCANLGEMTKIGLRVPPGFALSVDTYNDFMKMSGAEDDIKKYLATFGEGPKGLKQFNTASVEIRKIIQSKPMPKEMEKNILSCYKELSRKCNVKDVAVSTRSAGVVSHPGQYETHLNVVGETDLLNKIKSVWGSSFNARSLAFRSRKREPLESDPIGVAVLKMVNARSAGVLFTADPNTADTNRMIIEANWGLGESVVSGESTPDTCILDKESLKIQEKKLGPKAKYVTFKEVGVAEEAIPSGKSGKFCLTDKEAKEIGKLGKILESHFGKPQDIEWAIDDDLPFPDNVMLLQTRGEIIAQQKSPVDQIVDLMLSRLSAGTGFKEGKM